MTVPIAYFTWEVTTDQLRWNENASQRLGLADDDLESLARWSMFWTVEERETLSTMIAEASRERPDPLDMIVHQQDADGQIRMLRLSGDWVDGLICGVVADVAAEEATFRSPAMMTRQFAHDIAQPLAAASNYLAAMEMIVGQGSDDTALAEMAGAARNQVARAGTLIRELRERLIEAETP